MAFNFRIQKQGRINEERQFTEPAVRFRRIRGRIVPIFNKKRIGEITNRESNKLLVGGSVLAGAGVVKRAAKKSGFFRGFSLTKNSPLRSMGKFSPKSTGAKIALSSTKVITKPLVFALKNPLLVGAGIVAAGVAGRQIGFSLEANSAFGFDVGAKKP